MIQIRIDVLSIIYLGCTMLYGPFSKWPPSKRWRTIKILWQLNNYVPAIEAFYTYNFLVVRPLINQWEHLYSDSYHSPEQNDTTLGGWWGGCRTSVPSPWTTGYSRKNQCWLAICIYPRVPTKYCCPNIDHCRSLIRGNDLANDRSGPAIDAWTLRWHICWEYIFVLFY